MRVDTYWEENAGNQRKKDIELICSKGSVSKCLKKLTSKTPGSESPQPRELKEFVDELPEPLATIFDMLWKMGCCAYEPEEKRL